MRNFKNHQLSKFFENNESSDKIKTNYKDQAYQFAGKYSKKNSILLFSFNVVAFADRKQVSIQAQNQ